jgi:hypothetical protein
MSLVHFCRKLEEVPAGAVNVRLSTSYRSSVAQEWAVERGYQAAIVPPDVPEGEHPGDLYLYETHVGLCLEDSEQNGYHDSDFYMLVWNPETQAPESICFASTRGWSYPSYGSKADATPEVRAAYAEWKRAREEERERARAEWLATQVKVGQRVRVIGGRKLPKGTEAVVMWESRGPVYGPTLRRLEDRRLGIKPVGYTGRGYVFVGESQVQVITDE